MDDPWGSPWVDETGPPLPKGDELGSRGPATTELLRLNHTSRSLWDDEDGFGEWAALPVTDELHNSARVDSGTETVELVASANKGSGRGKDHIQPNGSAFMRKKQPTKPDSDLEIPRIIGGLSPDPWRVEAMDAEDKERISVSLKATAVESSFTSNPNGDGTRSWNSTESSKGEFGNEDIHELDKSTHATETLIPKALINHNQDSPVSVLDDNTTDLQTREVSQESLASRASSPSDHSHLDGVFAESPRTSFEEEEKRPKLEDEGTSKVKEMIYLFDHLASGDASVKLAGQLEMSAVVQPEDDFGDFEGIPYVSSEDHQLDEMPGIGLKNSLFKEELPTTNLSVGGETEVSSDQPVKLQSSVKFEPDLSLLSHVFGLTDGEFCHGDPKQALGIDNVIQDSFSSTNERKTWYRISRYGAMRKHNAGDGDDYVRVNWKDSKVRDDVLKIVGRWIEEDRMGGGIILDGGTRFGSMFGWDQKHAVPISVAEALASKSRRAGYSSHTRLQTSNSNDSPVNATGFNRNSVERATTSRKSFQMPLAIAPQFSWSSGAPISSATDTAPPIPPHPTSSNSPRHPFSSTPSSMEMLKESPLKRPSANAPATAPFSVQQPKVAFGNTKPLKHSGDQRVPRTRSNPLHSETRLDKSVSSPVSNTPETTPIEGQNKSGAMGPLNPKLASIQPSIESDHRKNRRTNKGVTSHGWDGADIPPRLDKVETTPSPVAKLDDAWATTDFSLFDSPAIPSPTPTGAPIPKASIPSPVFDTGSEGMPNSQTDEEKLVENIVQNLPNLSYMLRG